jgi:hypothetical protein
VMAVSEYGSFEGLARARAVEEAITRVFAA